MKNSFESINEPTKLEVILLTVRDMHKAGTLTEEELAEFETAISRLRNKLL